MTLPPNPENAFESLVFVAAKALDELHDQERTKLKKNQEAKALRKEKSEKEKVDAMLGKATNKLGEMLMLNNAPESRRQEKLRKRKEKTEGMEMKAERRNAAELEKEIKKAEIGLGRLHMEEK